MDVSFLERVFAVAGPVASSDGSAVAVVLRYADDSTQS